MNREIKSAKSRYYCDLIGEAKGDLSKLWTAVNEASSPNSKSSIHNALSLTEFVIQNHGQSPLPRTLILRL